MRVRKSSKAVLPLATKARRVTLQQQTQAAGGLTCVYAVPALLPAWYSATSPSMLSSTSSWGRPSTRDTSSAGTSSATCSDDDGDS